MTTIPRPRTAAVTSFVDAQMHLGVELAGAGCHPGAARWSGQDPAALGGVPHHLGLVMAAARRGLEFVTLPAGLSAGGADAVSFAARVAPLVPGIGLIPAVDVTGADGPAAGVTMLDSVSAGRVGWQPTVPAGATGDRWDAVAEAVDAVARHWSADPASPLHAGAAHPPLVVVRVDGPDVPPAAARRADVVRIAATGLDAAHAIRERVRAAVAAEGRDPDRVPVLLDVEVHLAADAHQAREEVAALDAIAPAEPSSVRVLGRPSDVADLVGATVRLGAADGITMLPLVLPVDLRRIAVDVVPLLAGRGLFRTGRSGLWGAPARRLPATSTPASA
jgi:alkanesulfonate monooxygenase SsuD/methylene tetrahydromethanopterin reductase-like flavin-dependent oxidoreductase (luciferase family)